MDTREREATATRAPRGRGTVITWAGIAAVALIGIAAVLLMDGEEPVPPADQPPIEIAQEFVAATARWDVETTSRILAPDAMVLAAPARSAEDWEAYLRWREKAGFSFSIDGCEVEATGQQAVVACAIGPQSVWADALGIEVTGQDRFRVSIEEGRVVIVTHAGSNSSDPDSMAQVWNRFHEWVASNHPEALSVMHTEDGQADPVLETVALNDESIERWGEMTELFGSEIGG